MKVKKNKIEKVSFKAGFQRRDPVFFVFSRIIFWKNKGSHVVYNIGKEEISKGDEKNDKFLSIYMGTYIIQMNMETLILIPVWILIMN